MQTPEQVILVNEQDQQIGQAEKLDTHQKGLCHRAFSIFVFRQIDNAVELLLQQRQHNKYHSAGLWTNTCCGHPRPGEGIIEAGVRRLHEEMGFKVDLQDYGVFHYRAKFDNGLIEDEMDHILCGSYQNQKITPNPNEVADFRWQEINEIKKEWYDSPDLYTEWFNEALRVFESKCEF